MAIANIRLKLPRAGKICLGDPKLERAPGRNRPYFRVESEIFSEEQLKSALGEQPEKLEIFFPKISQEDSQASLDFIFEDNYKCFKAGKLFCTGNGVTATRSVSKTEIREVDCTCEYLQKNECRQQGELRVGLAALPFLGYFYISTHSWNSIASIRAVLDMYYKLLGEKFWTTKFLLYKEKQILKGNTQYILKLTIHPEFAKQLPSASEMLSQMAFEDVDDTTPPTPPITEEKPARKVTEKEIKQVTQEMAEEGVNFNDGEPPIDAPPVEELKPETGGEALPTVQGPVETEPPPADLQPEPGDFGEPIPQSDDGMSPTGAAQSDFEASGTGFEAPEQANEVVADNTPNNPDSPPVEEPPIEKPGQEQVVEDEKDSKPEEGPTKPETQVGSTATSTAEKSPPPAGGETSTTPAKVDPKLRMARQRLINAVKGYAPLVNMEHLTPEQVIETLCGKPITELGMEDVQAELAKVIGAVNEAKKGTPSEKAPF